MYQQNIPINTSLPHKIFKKKKKKFNSTESFRINWKPQPLTVYQTFRFLSARGLPSSETRESFPARLDPVGPLTRGIMIRDYVTNYDEPAVKSKTAARSSWIMSLVERSRGGEVDLGERELSEERTPLWPRGESVLCACLSQGQPLSVQYMPATFTRTRANTADRLTVVYRVSCELSRDWTLSVVKSRKIAARWRLRCVRGHDYWFNRSLQSVSRLLIAIGSLDDG